MLAQKDGDTLSSLYQMYALQLGKIAYSILNDYALAQDVVQEAFLRLIKRETHTLREVQSKPYLISITKHICYDICRKQKLEAGYFRAGGECGFEESMEEQVEHALEFHDLCSQLSFEERALLLQFELLGIPQKELANQRDISIDAVKKRLQRIRDKLRLQAGVSSQNKT